MKYGALAGDITESGHVGWIELTGASWGIGRTVSDPTGSPTARVIAAPRVRELVVSREQDLASIPLVQESLAGKPAAVQIDWTRTGTGGPEVYYTISLVGAVLSDFAQSSAGDRPTESLTLNFTAITVKGSQMAADGSGAAPVSYGWNLATAAPA